MLCSDFKCNYFCDDRCYQTATPTVCAADHCQIYGECISCQMLPDDQCTGIRNAVSFNSRATATGPEDTRPAQTANGPQITDTLAGLKRRT